MVYEKWWEEYKNSTVIISKQDNPITLSLVICFLSIIMMIQNFITEWHSISAAEVLNKMIAYIIAIAIILKIGEFAKTIIIRRRQKKRFQEDEKIFIKCLNMYKKENLNELEEFLDTTSDSACEAYTKNLLYTNIIIIITFLLTSIYILEFLFDILAKNKRTKNDEYKLAIIAKNHLYNIKKNKKEDSWGDIILMVMNKLQHK